MLRVQRIAYKIIIDINSLENLSNNERFKIYEFLS